jgi:hypothetical protein
VGEATKAPSGKQPLYPVHEWDLEKRLGCAVTTARHEGYEVEVVCLDKTPDVTRLRLVHKLLGAKVTDPKRLLATSVEMEPEDMYPKWDTIDAEFWRDVDAQSLTDLKDAIARACVVTRFAHAAWLRNRVFTPLIYGEFSEW